jgi:hypothetical protein
MATRKKKTEVIESADIAEMVNKPSGGWPKIVQGTHLTVKTFEDGHTELVWDDDALLAEVRAALLKAESVLPVTETKPKRTKKAKE